MVKSLSFDSGYSRVCHVSGMSLVETGFGFGYRKGESTDGRLHPEVLHRFFFPTKFFFLKVTFFFYRFTV